MGRVVEAYEKVARKPANKPPHLRVPTDTSLSPERLERALEDMTILVHNVSPSERDRVLAFFFNQG
jgi:hypothetical protein